MTTFPHLSLLQFFFLVSLCFFNGTTSTGGGGGDGGDIVKESCRRCAKGDANVNYDFCVTALQTVPKSHNATLKELGLIAMKLTKTNASSTKTFITNLLKNKKIDPEEKLALKDCKEIYSEAIDLLKEAMMDFKYKLYFEANIRMSSVMDSPSTCEQGFAEKKGKASPLNKQNKDMFQLAAISLSIINMVAGKSYY